MAYYKKWGSVFVSILFTCLLFIPWDIYFTGKEVWGFNSEYLLGISLFSLPLEEVLFFITVPFACIFIYECVLSYLKPLIQITERLLNWVWLLIFLALSISLIIIFQDRIYTVAVVSLSALVVLILSVFARNYMAISLVSFVIIGIPFFIINSALTGLFSDAPIVWYSDWGISTIRVGTIPMEDFFYNLLLVASSFFFYLGWERLVLKKPIDL